MKNNAQYAPALDKSTTLQRMHASRPMRDLMTQLRQTSVLTQHRASVTELTAIRASLATNAETVMHVCQNGMAALGQLIAHSSPVIEDGTIDAGSLEALGWLIAELGDLSSYCLVLTAECRRGDFSTGLSKVA